VAIPVPSIERVAGQGAGLAAGKIERCHETMNFVQQLPEIMSLASWPGTKYPLRRFAALVSQF
jgi:hypothetical protein